MVSIGHHTLRNALVLSPMAGVTDAPFRKLCMEKGAGLAIAEMISANPALRDTDKSQLRQKQLPLPADIPRVVQIAGTEPAEMAAAAQYNAELGADIIDINMGCPAKKVCSKLAGSALLSDEKLVTDILSATVNAVDIPVTLKFRTGPTQDSRNALIIAQIAEQAGIQSLALHGRTREDKYLDNTVEYRSVTAVKQAVNIPVFANGDIRSPQQAKQILDNTGVDGLYIGRAAQGNPWIFAEINHYLNTSTELSAPALSEIETTVLQHIAALHDFYGEPRGIRVARKHISWYLEKIGLQFDCINYLQQQRSQLMGCGQAATQLKQLETLFSAIKQTETRHAA